MKLIGEIKEIKGKSYSYRVKVKITNTFHPSLSLPKGIGGRAFIIKRKWVYPFIPGVGSKISIDGKEIGVEIEKVGLSNELLSLFILPELGGRIAFIQYRDNKPIQSELLYGRDTSLVSVGITEDLGEKTGMNSWKFEIKDRSAKSLKMECKKKGWDIKKKISINKNIINQEFRIKREGREKKADCSFSETLSFLPDIRKLSIYLPTREKVFISTTNPVVSPWHPIENFYNLTSGLIVKAGKTVIGWSTDMKDIGEVIIREEEWLTKIISTWNKISIKKGKMRVFKTTTVIGEDFKIEKKRIGIKSSGKWLWIIEGKCVS